MIIFIKPFQFQHRYLRTAAILLAAILQAGCLGGTVTQQLARSLFIHGADKATAAAMDAHENDQKPAARYLVPADKALDAYQIAFLRAGFETIQPQIEPLPPSKNQETQQHGSSNHKPVATPALQSRPLVHVEIWNVLLGDEKNRLLEKAMLHGSPAIPPKAQWSTWQIAIGAVQGHAVKPPQNPITFLIPPDLGKLPSGSKALVELAEHDELSIARYSMR